jgi:hypothetical protein
VTGSAVRIHAAGTLAATANNKAVRLRFNGVAGTVLIDSGTVNTNLAAWELTMTGVWTGGFMEVASMLRINTAGAVTPGPVTVTRFSAQQITIAANTAYTFDITGQSPTTGAVDDVICLISLLEIIL